MSAYEVPGPLSEETLRDRAIHAVAKRIEGDPFAEEVVVGVAELAMAGVVVANNVISNIKSRLTH